MLRQYTNILKKILILTDASLIMGAFFLAYFARRYWVSGLFLHDFYFIKDYWWVLPFVLVPWMMGLYFSGIYNSLRLKTVPHTIWTILKCGVATFVVFGTLIYMFKMDHISRSFIGFFFIFSGLLLIIEKTALILLFRQLRSKGFNFRNVLVTGTGRRAQNFIKYLNEHRELGLKIIGVVDVVPVQKGQTLLGHPVIGCLEDFPQVLKENVIDHAVFLVPRNCLSKIEPALLQCEMVGVPASVAMDLFNLEVTHGRETSFLGIPMISFERTQRSVSALMIKHAIDISVSTVALFIISPVYAAIAVAIKLTSPGPVYFCQDRVGLNGRIFKLYKFRTMVVDAEEKLMELESFNEMKGPAFKMQNDPRITKIGGFLRKYSLDELPQLWNVFHGDMSLVGPRPPLPREVKQYDPWHQRRLSMRPGITCAWQVGGRNRITDFDQWVKMDLEYIDNWSLALDFKILCQTIPAVLSTSGAK